jgi:hypothetical protein
MPAKPGSLIQTHEGVRRLLNDELAKGLGVPKTWLGDRYPSGKAVANTVSLHLFEGLTSSFVVPERLAEAGEGPSHGPEPPSPVPQESLSIGSPRIWPYETPGPLIEEGL